jgi:hypothetical protein
MPAFKDLTGRRFGKLVVTGLHPERTGYGMTKWVCRCDCGSEKTVTVGNLGKNTNSCGCIRNTQGALTRKHPLWGIWSAMIQRCTDIGCKSYPLYGGRGIRVCDRWKSFPNFLEDMEASYRPGLSIDRKNNNKGYNPSNCRWATAKQQGRNRRCCIMIDTPWGKLNVAEAAERIGMDRNRFRTRVKLGWTTAQLFDPRNHKALTKWDRRKGARSANS